MNRHQEYLFGLLKEIDQLCRDNGITYYLGMGSLIGAVRQGGFLPWDDDADILMTAGEFEKLKELSRSGAFPANRLLGSPDLEESYCHILPRYVSRDTTAFHTCQSLADDVAGEVIDIFVLDPIADGQGAYDKYIEDMYLYASIVNYANVAATRFNLDPELYRRYYEIEQSQGRMEARHQLEERLESNFSDEGDRYIFRWQGVPLVFDRAWFDGHSTVTFEGHEFMAPSNVNAFLTRYYGEEWPEVPGNISPSKHNAAFSLDFPYTEALEYYKPSCDRAELRRKMDERKLAVLRHAPTDNALVDERAQATAAIVASQQRARLEDNRELYERALSEGDGQTLALLLDDYLSWQTSKEMIGRHVDSGTYRSTHPILMDLGDEVFEAGLLALFSTGRIRLAAWLLDVRREKGLALTPRMEELSRALDDLHATMGDFETGAHADGATRAERLLGAFPQVDYFRQILAAHLHRLYVSSDDGETLARFGRVVDAGLAEHPESGVYLKFRADCLAAGGRQNEARTLYLQAAERTRNGFSLLGIEELTGYYPTWLREPDWAKDAGVPQWDGPAPEPLAADAAQAKPAPAVKDPRTEYLFGLLAELAGICDAHGIRYVLCPAACQSLFQAGALPGIEAAYTLWLEKPAYRKLVDVLAAELPENRQLEYPVTNPSMKTAWLRYRGTDSLRLSLKAGSLAKFPTMYVTAKPLEPERYPLGLERVLAQIRETPGAEEFHPKGRRARLYATVHRLGTARAGAYAKAFWLMMDAPAPEGTGYIRDKGKMQAVDLAFLRCTQTRGFRDVEFSVPAAIDTYVAELAEGKVPAAFRPPKNVLCCASMTYDGLVASGALSADYFERKRAAAKANAPYKETLAAFRENFRQIKAAIGKKQAEVNASRQRGQAPVE